MTNRKLIEYLKVFGNNQYLKEDKKYGVVLDSDVSIKEFIFEYRDINIGDNIEDTIESMWNILIALFKSINDKGELEKYLMEITKILRAYKRYLDKYKLVNMILGLLISIQYHKGKLTLETINKYKLVYKSTIVVLDDKIYNIEYHYNNNYKMELTYGSKNIGSVGAVVIKDNEYKIYRCNSFEDMEKLKKEVINTYDFDIAIIAS